MEIVFGEYLRHHNIDDVDAVIDVAAKLVV